MSDWDQWIADDPPGVDDLLLGEPEPPEFLEADESDDFDLVGYWDEFDSDISQPRGPSRVLSKGKSVTTPAPATVFGYHLTSINNLQKIVAGEKIECRNHLPDIETIGDRDLAARRHKVGVPTIGGDVRSLDNYVSFYFASYTPMLARLVKNPYPHSPPLDDLVILRAPIADLSQLRPLLFTDRQSMCPTPPANVYTLLSSLGAVDFDLIGSGSWFSESEDEMRDRRRRYQAELLALYDVPFSAIDRCAGLTAAGVAAIEETVGDRSAVVRPKSLTEKLRLPP